MAYKPPNLSSATYPFGSISRERYPCLTQLVETSRRHFLPRCTGIPWLRLWLGLSAAVACAQSPPLELTNPVGGGVRSAAPATAANSPGSPFFVTGRLERVRRGTSGATRYALLNDQGQVAAFVGADDEV